LGVGIFVATLNGRCELTAEGTPRLQVQWASNNKDTPFDHVHSIAACA